MPRFVDIDLTDAPPAQGGQGGDRVPPGKYLLELKNVALGSARSSGRPMYTVILQVASGEGTKGKSIADNFALPQTQTDSKFGLQRFHAFLLAVGLKIDKPQIRIDLDRLTGRFVVGDVYDDTIPASGGYDERVVSKVSAYYPPPAANGATPAAETPAEPAFEAPQALPQPAAVGVSETQVAQASEELDDLFAR